MRRVPFITVTLVVTSIAGCGFSVTADFPNRLVGAGGQSFFLEDLEEIANDPDLDDDEKRAQFRDLGIEDEELIDVLLGL